jgi:capsid protein
MGAPRRAARRPGQAAFRRAHQWSTLARLAAACWDEERAIAVGYASHLLADVVAHNRFVPEHERRIVDAPHVTHALCEWAMDEHLKSGIEDQPAALLQSQTKILAEAAARTFRCREALASRAIVFLARAERLLRASRLPRLCRRTMNLLQGDTESHFDAYMSEARGLVRQMDTVLRGEEPRWQPEPDDQVMRNEAAAISAPSAAPAITSLG